MKIKKNSLRVLMCMLLMGYSVCYAQISPVTPNSKYEIISMNFFDSEVFSNTSKLEFGKTYVFIVEDLNRNLYKLDKTINQTDFNAEVPSIFKDIKLPGFLNLALPESEKSDGVNTIKDGGGSISDEITLILNEIKSYALSLEAIVNYENYIVNLSNSCSLPYSSIENKLITETNKFENVDTNDRAVQVAQLEQYLKDLIKNSTTAYEQLKSLSGIQKSKSKNQIKDNELEILKAGITQPDKSKDIKSKYARSVILVSNLTNENKANTTYLADLKVTIEKAKSIVDEIKKLNSGNKIQTLLNKYNKINRSNFTYVSEPIKVKGDELTIQLSVTSENLLACNASNSQTIKKTFKVEGGWKVDFSTGLFVNGGNDDFFGRELYYSKESESSKSIKAKDGGDRLLLGIGGLMHIYKRITNDVNWAISPGLSSSTSFDHLNFHLGGSAIFGVKNRLVITAGLTLRESKILDKSFKLNTEYQNDDLPESPPTIKVFPRIGYFFSFTYNFSKFKS